MLSLLRCATWPCSILSHELVRSGTGLPVDLHRPRSNCSHDLSYFASAPPEYMAPSANPLEVLTIVNVGIIAGRADFVDDMGVGNGPALVLSARLAAGIVRSDGRQRWRRGRHHRSLR